jgi:hypothetical protein
MNKLGVYQSWLNINWFDLKNIAVSKYSSLLIGSPAASHLRLALCRCSTKLPLPRCPVLSKHEGNAADEAEGMLILMLMMLLLPLVMMMMMRRRKTIIASMKNNYI